MPPSSLREYFLDGGDPGTLCVRRLFEWMMTLAMLAIGGEVFFQPRLISASMFRYVAEIIEPAAFAGMLLVAAFARTAALLANGSLPVAGPAMRSLSALIGVAVWILMGTSLARVAGVDGLPPALTVPLFLVLAFGELLSVYRAASEAKIGYGQRQ